MTKRRTISAVGRTYVFSTARDFSEQYVIARARECLY
jgi:hypothetical protein